MDKFDRFQMLHRVFKARRRPVPLAILAEQMECTERTVRRVIDLMRDRLFAPIEYFPRENGWQYAADADHFELPGLWLTSAELQSLAMLLHLLEHFGHGLLGQELAPVEKHLHKLLQARGISPGIFAERVRILPMATRQVPSTTFATVGEALLKRRRLRIRYRGFSGSVSRRTISPQTLVHYRENWYLDAWCHLRNDLRTFSLARMEVVALSDDTADTIPERQLHEHFTHSYGLFAGKPEHTARLRFLPDIAREISLQQWHPEQTGQWDGDAFLLTFPYSDPRELAGDIMRYLPNVVVEAPDSLKAEIETRLRLALERNTAART